MALPTTMKAITLPASPASSYAHPARGSSLILNPSHPIPSRSPTQALLRIHAATISPFELTWEETYSAPQPRIVSHDVSGTITSCPPGSGFSPGDGVFGMVDFSGHGGMAEYAVADLTYFAKTPRNLDFVQAASLPIAVLTPWQGLVVRGGGVVRRGMRVLVTGASGAVGRMAVQVVREAVGEEGVVIAVGGKGSDELKGLGADVVVNFRETRDWEAVVRERGVVDVVFDCVGGVTLAKCLGLVRDGGQVVTIASPPPVWEDVKGWKGAQERGVKGSFFIVEGSGKQLGDIAALIEKGAIKPSVSLVVDGLTEDGVRGGWTAAEKGGLSGSVVVKVV